MVDTHTENVGSGGLYTLMEMHLLLLQHGTSVHLLL